MAEKTISVTLYSKRSFDYAGLVSSNPVLAKKEFIVIRVTDADGITWCAYKMGDGTKKFGDLAWRKIRESKLLKLSNTSMWTDVSDVTATMNARDFKEVE